MKITVSLCLVTAIVLSFSSCKEKFTEKTSFAMESVLTMKIMTDDEEKSNELFTLINDAVIETDNTLSSTKEDSMVFQLNKSGSTEPSPLLMNIISDAVTVCSTLGGKVDITLGRVTDLWGFSADSPSLPSDEDISTALESADPDNIKIDKENNKITLKQGTWLDLGAIGKGAACDRIFDKVKSSTTPLIVTLGGTVFAYGEGPSDGKWTIGIRDPFKDANSIFATAELRPTAPKNAVFVSTSGSYEKTFTENGKVYHHILDPKTGYPAESEVISVTVSSCSGLNSDALSTYCFINGLNATTLETLEIYDAQAIFVFADKTYYVTEELGSCLSVTDDSFTLREYDEK